MNTSTRANGPRGESYSVGDRVQQISRDAQALSAALRSAAIDTERFLTEHVHQNPASTLAVAAALGYVLGGGLRSRLTSLFLGIGSRLAMAIAARELAVRLGIAPDAQRSPSATPPWSEHRH